MKSLDHHILKELAGPFLFGVGAFASLMFAGKELFKITELLAEYHAPFLTAVKLVGLHLPSIVVLTLPMAMLLSVLLAFGRLSGDSEIVALYAGGISLYRIAVPVVVVSVLVTGASFVLNEIIVPKTNSAHENIIKELKNEPLTSEKPFVAIDAENGETNAVFCVQGRVDAETGRVHNIWLVRYWKNEPVVFMRGEEAVWKGGNEWLLERGYSRNINSSDVDSASVTMEFEKSRIVKINKTPEELALYQKKYDQLSFSELKNYIRMRRAEGIDVNEDLVRLYQKIAIPLASLVFALIGIPLGIRPHRSSSAMGLGLAIVIIFAYWIFTDYMTVLGINGAMSPMAASFLPTLAGACLGLALISRAAK